MRVRHLMVLLFLLVGGALSCSKEDTEVLDYKTLGSSAKDLLTSSKYQALELEISTEQGYELPDDVVSHLQNFLQTYLNKPGGINIYRQVISDEKTTVGISDVVALERKFRTKFTRPGVVAVHIMVLDAQFTEFTVLGNAYWNTSMAVYGQAINRFSGGNGQVSSVHLLSTLIEHEFGHLLGLVDQGSPMVLAHKDVNNGAHCIDQYCLMNHLIQTTSSSAPQIPVLDKFCRDDLKNNGGK